jgi:hypothetical protein
MSDEIAVGFDEMRRDLNETRGILLSTVDGLLKRGDQLVTIASRADALAQASRELQQRATPRRVRRYVIFTVLVVVVVALVFVTLHLIDKRN